jgi:hypothetical protein
MYTSDPQRSMDGTHLRDLEQPGMLRRVQIPEELQRPFHAIEPSRFRLALGAIRRMNPGMREANDHLLQRHRFRRAYSATVMDAQLPSAASSRSYGVGPDRYQCRRSRRFVHGETMRACRDLLGASALIPERQRLYRELRRRQTCFRALRGGTAASPRTCSRHAEDGAVGIVADEQRTVVEVPCVSPFHLVSRHADGRQHISQVRNTRSRVDRNIIPEQSGNLNSMF